MTVLVLCIAFSLCRNYFRLLCIPPSDATNTVIPKQIKKTLVAVLTLYISEKYAAHKVNTNTIDTTINLKIL